ncbi:MAG TPA: hypothetical protein VMB21_04715 [Candidatus Limnocylindria bacterium]|jgi:hypothetical protein|nr:hypothetical protein [Candidatus Limnocylindria bacterium]HTL67227.1 hypothetical protein [Lacunisphaera sp.]
MNGFLTPDMEFVHLQARSEVFAPAVQAILIGLHRRDGIICGCRFPEPVRLQLEVVKQPDGRFRLDRRSVADLHRDDCIFRLAEDFEAQPPRPELVFDLTGQREASAPAFRHVARHVLSAAHSSIFARSLAVPARGSTVAEFLAEIEHRAQRAHAYPFYSLQAAAAERGLALSFGFLCSPPDHAPADAVVSLVFETWSEVIRGMTAMIVPVDGQVWEDAMASLRVLGRYCVGPYFFVAAINQAGLVVKLALFPIYLDAGQVIPVDSHTERKRVAQLVGAGISPYKAVRLDHLREMVKRAGRALGVALPVLQFRADFVYLDGRILVVEEVRGFAPGRLADYDAHFDQKARLAESNPCSQLRHSVCNGWLLPEPGLVSCPYRDGGLPIQVRLDANSGGERSADPSDDLDSILTLDGGNSRSQPGDPS